MIYDFILFNLSIFNFLVKIEYESTCAYCPNKFFIWFSLPSIQVLIE